ncbi:MAG: GH92 family glycosyl hydrolase [Endozoicomonas sp.]|uniref:GH92 family glycosyl hydrolase n=1 Tax=Endozoicomonas sp. TaxID=1892382 RepID=UPI003D9B6650
MLLKKSVLSAAIAITLAALSGCDSNDEDEEVISGGGDNPIHVEGPGILKYVDPFIGTGFNGHTFPGAVLPEGFVQLSPDNQLTGWHSSSGYHNDNDTIYGFSHTHLSGTGIGDLGDILFLPFTGDKSESSKFRKSQEGAKPGFYQVELDDTGIVAELTATQRVGLHRYTFPEGETQKLKIDLGHTLNEDWGGVSLINELEIVDDYTVIGKRYSGGWAADQRVYFTAKFNKPIAEYIITSQGEPQSGSSYKTEGNDVVAYIEFDQDSSPLEVKVGLSPVSTDGAERNLMAEANELTFDEAVTKAENTWLNNLDDFEVEGGTDAELTNFYTALYHTKIAPMVHQDADGQYLGMDKAVYDASSVAENYQNYTVYSMWDTFRALHPLKTITEPEKAGEYAVNLIQKYKEGGLLPKWELHSNYTGTMVGYPSVAIITDAMVKGLADDVDPADALEAAVASSTWHPEDFTEWDQELLKTVMTPHIKYIEMLGYAPADKTHDSVSYGLENAYYDWTISLIAEMAGDQAKKVEYEKRAQGYREYFDHNPEAYAEHSATGFMRPKMLDGSWREPFDPYNAEHETGDYTEGNSWQWTWFVPQDIPGLKEVMGGEEAFKQNLDALFNAREDEGTSDMTGLIGQYVQGNEPDQHVPYLYNYTDTPWKTQEIVDEILDEFYLPTPEGIVGNEDVGAMSAWYVMSALGFYQITPGDATYTIGRPLFDKVTIPVGHSGTFSITAENNGPDNIYVQSVTINGHELEEGLFFEYSEFRDGGELSFVMGPEPKALN